MCFAFLDQSPLLPSLSSLIRALQDTKNGLLASVDIQDFHLPDEDFGQLKLERLRLSTSLVEPFVQRVYNTRRSNRCQTTSCKNNNTEVLDGELFTPTSFALEDSLPLCQSDPVERSQIETQTEKHAEIVKEPNTRSSDQMDCVEEQTWTVVKTEKTENDEHTVKIQTSGSENVDPEVQSHKQTDSHALSENSPLCPALLDLSLSLTSHTQRGQDSSLPSLGMTPHFLSPGSPTDLQPHLLYPADSCMSPSLNIPTGCVSPDSVPSKTFRDVKANTSKKSSDPTEIERDTEIQNQTKVSQEVITEAQNNANDNATRHENLMAPETEMQALCIMESEQKCSFDTENNLEFRSKTDCTPEIKALHDFTESDNQKTQNSPKIEVQTCKHTKTETHEDMVINQCQCVDASGVGHDKAISFDTSTNQKTEDKAVCTTNADEAKKHGTGLSNSSPVSSTTLPKAGHCSSVLRETHTFKVPEMGAFHL